MKKFIKKTIVVVILSTSLNSYAVGPETFGGWYRTDDVIFSTKNKQFPYTLKMSTTNDNYQVGAVAEIKPPLDTNNKALRVFVKSSDWNNTKTFSIIFGSDSYKFENTLTVDIKNGIISLQDNQWIEIIIPFSDFESFGSPNASKINSMLWIVRSSEQKSINVEIGGIEVIENWSNNKIVSKNISYKEDYSNEESWGIQNVHRSMNYNSSPIEFYQPSFYKKTNVITTGIRFEHDTDSSSWHEHYVSLKHENQDFSAELKQGIRKYNQNNNKHKFTTSSIEGEYKISQQVKLQGSFGSFNNSNTSIYTSSGNIIFTPDANWRTEFFASRDFVDSYQGILQKIYANTYGISVDRKLNQQFVATGSLSQQNHSDNVNKISFNTRLIYTPERIKNYNFQLKYRQTNTDVPTGYIPPYFSPKNDQRFLLTTKYHSTHDNNLSVVVYVGGGVRKIDGESFAHGEYGVKISKHISARTKANIKYECNQDFRDSTYCYCWGGASINVEF